MGKMQHALSALSMNVGLLSEWEEWKPFPKDTPVKWLLMSGAIDPPEHIQISNRRPRKSTSTTKSGNYLAGMSQDLGNMSAFVDDIGLFNYAFNMRMTKEDAIKNIKDLFEACVKNEPKAAPVIYYTGHGESKTGNWCFQNHQLGIREIVSLIPPGCYHPLIISDSCFSGCWADYCLNQHGTNNIRVLAACPYYTYAYDNEAGGEFTQYITGKIPKEKLKATPVYGFPGKPKDNGSNTQFISGKIPTRGQMNRSHLQGVKGQLYPTTCKSFVDLVKNHLNRNENRVLVSFDVFLDNKISALFADLENGQSKKEWEFEEYKNADECSAGITHMQNIGFKILEMVKAGDKWYVYFIKSLKKQFYSSDVVNSLLRKGNRFSSYSRQWHNQHGNKMQSFGDEDSNGAHRYITDQMKKGYKPFSVRSDFHQKTYLLFTNVTLGRSNFTSGLSNFQLVMGITKH